MATLYEIKQEILDCIDMETGEIIDAEKLAELQMDKHEKLRNIAFVAINATADAAAYKEQEQKFAARRKAAEKTAAWAKETLARELDGKPMKEAEFSVGYRKSEQVELAEGLDLSTLPPEFITVSEPKANKTELKKAIKAGAVIEGVSLVEKQNIQIK